MARTSNKIGAEFEGDVQAEFDEMKKRTRLRYVRLYDTKSARGRFMPKQPGDFIVATPLGGTLLECKASDKYLSLSQCLSSAVEEQQAAAARLWSRTGNPSLFLFYSFTSDLVEAWDGNLVGEHRAAGTRLPKAGAITTANKMHLRSLLDKLLFDGWTQ